MKDNLITRLFGSRSKSFASDVANNDLLGWHPGGNTLHHYDANQYENGYASIQAIVRRFWNIIPYAIDGNGKTLQNQNVTNVLARPNRDMSGLDFREALAVMALVHDKVYIRVHHKGTRITESSVEGFTFLEGVSEHKIDDHIEYRTNGKVYSTDNVIVLKNINPYNLGGGFSASRGARRWTRIDDYITDYQSGFFENGAVPAGQFVITAPTAVEYRDIVSNLQKKHRGAGKNNNVTYTYAPIDQTTGKAGQAAITWVPFNNTNKDLDLKNLFDQVNKKIDSTYGVPASIRGVNEGNTYASVRVDETIFIDQVIRPFTQKLWTRFTHELNRITGGLGYAITFDIDTPHIAEEEKTDAEKKQVEMNVLTTMLDKGFKLDSIISAFDLSTSYKTLKLDPNFTPAALPVATTIVNDQPQVDNGGEAANAPTTTTKAVTVTKTLSDTERATLEERVGTAVRRNMEQQLEQAVTDLDDAGSKAIGDINPEMNLKLATDLFDVIIPAMISKGIIDQQQGIALLAAQGVNVGQLSSFTMSPEQSAWYRNYLKNVATSYNADTGESIRQSLKAAQEADLSAYETKTRLRSILNSDEYRVRRIAVTETNRIGGKSSVYAMENIQAQTGVQVAKVWNTGGADPCEFCSSHNGKQVAVSDNFSAEGDIIIGSAGGTLTNSFVDMDTADMHPHCKCYTTYRVVKD